MRQPLTTYFLFFFCFGQSFAQDSPVHWSLSFFKETDNTYRIGIKAQVEAGWRVYAAANKVAGINGVRVSWPGSIEVVTPLSCTAMVQTISDPLFNTKLKIYLDSFQLSQRVIIPSPSVTVLIIGYAARKDEFIPLRFEQQLPLGEINCYAINGSLFDCGDPDLTPFNHPVGYTDARRFSDWLECGRRTRASLITHL